MVSMWKYAEAIEGQKVKVNTPTRTSAAPATVEVYCIVRKLCYSSQLDPETLTKPCRSQLAPLSLSLLLIQSHCWAQPGVNYSHTWLLTANPLSGGVYFIKDSALCNIDIPLSNEMWFLCRIVMKKWKHPAKS